MHFCRFPEIGKRAFHKVSSLLSFQSTPALTLPSAGTRSSQGWVSFVSVDTISWFTVWARQRLCAALVECSYRAITEPHKPSEEWEWPKNCDFCGELCTEGVGRTNPSAPLTCMNIQNHWDCSLSLGAIHFCHWCWVKLLGLKCRACSGDLPWAQCRCLSCAALQAPSAAEICHDLRGAG